ncbi:prepilin-type N-terminal cleavage/methylation domain-containing protein [Patescibacteria group bacterium]|nr:prepilin-type N-terminal cleavage/methylation domain-containing protein [Patescibacteria group bacterium]
MQNKILKNNQGMSLIEVVISITVLIIGIIGLLQAFPKGISVQHSIELETIANHLAQEKIENISALAYEDITAGTIENQVPMGADPSSEFYKFKRTTIVELVDQNLAQSAQDIGLKKITITVEWPKPLSDEADFASIITLVSER